MKTETTATVPAFKGINGSLRVAHRGNAVSGTAAAWAVATRSAPACLAASTCEDGNGDGGGGGAGATGLAPEFDSGGPVTRYELHFGLRRGDGSVVSESAWETFAGEHLPSCFPQGYTVLTGSGCWRSPSGRWFHEPVKVVVVIVPVRPPLFGVTLAALALCWKRFADQEAVLAVESTAEAVQL